MSKRNEKKSSPPRKSKRGGKRTKPRGGAPQTGATIARSGVPVAMAMEFPRFYTNISSIAHKMHGDGVRLSGTQQIGIFGPKNTFYDVYTSIAGEYYQLLHPAYFNTNGRFYAIVVQYQRFGFRRLKLWYMPNCPTDTTGSFATSYYQDPVECSGLPTSTTFSELTESGNVQVYQAWRASTTDLTSYLDKDFLGWTDLDAAGTDVSWRQQIQGGFKAASSQAAGSTAQWGTVLMEYEIELYQPCRFIDRALSTMKYEEVHLRAALQERRARVAELKAREQRDRELADKSAAFERLLVEETTGPTSSSTQGPTEKVSACASAKCAAHCK